MNTSNLYRDVAIGVFSIAAIFGFVSGQFILSTMLFGMASLASNIEAAKSVRL